MVRTQVQFEEKTYERVRTLAHRKRISVSEAVRRLVRAGLGDDPQADERCGAEALLDLAGIARGKEKDLGRNHDHYLSEDLD